MKKNDTLPRYQQGLLILVVLVTAFLVSSLAIVIFGENSNLDASDVLSAIVAFIGVLIAGFAYHSTHEHNASQRRHNELQMTPFLSWSSDCIHKINRDGIEGLQITLTLTNQGAGVAIIKENYFLFEGMKFTSTQPIIDAIVSELVKVQAHKQGVKSVSLRSDGIRRTLNHDDIVGPGRHHLYQDSFYYLNDDKYGFNWSDLVEDFLVCLSKATVKIEYGSAFEKTDDFTKKLAYVEKTNVSTETI